MIMDLDSAITRRYFARGARPNPKSISKNIKDKSRQSVAEEAQGRIFSSNTDFCCARTQIVPVVLRRASVKNITKD